MWCREVRVVLPEEEEDGEACGEGEERGEGLENDGFGFRGWLF